MPKVKGWTISGMFRTRREANEEAQRLRFARHYAKVVPHPLKKGVWQCFDGGWRGL